MSQLGSEDYRLVCQARQGAGLKKMLSKRRQSYPIGCLIAHLYMIG